MKRLNRFIDSNQDGLFKFYDKICVSTSSFFAHNNLRIHLLVFQSL